MERETARFLVALAAGTLAAAWGIWTIVEAWFRFKAS